MMVKRADLGYNAGAMRHIIQYPGKLRGVLKGLVTVAFVAVVVGAVVGGVIAVQRHNGDRTKVLIIGLDGLDWNILNPLLEKGKLPNIARLIESGTSGPLQSEEESSSPVIWTTIATGKARTEHGITSFYREGYGSATHTPFTSADRKVAALWNIMGMMHRTVGCFGWWCTFPAEEVNGTMVSSFVTYDEAAYAKRGLHAGEEVANLTYPRELYKDLTPFVVKPGSVTREQISRFVNITDWGHPMFHFSRVAAGPGFVLPWTYATDLSFVQIAEHLMSRRHYDLSMVYIQGTDTVCHRFWSFREQSNVLRDTLTKYNLFPEEEETYRRYFGETIDNYYIFADELVGRLVALADEKTVVILCSDHGFGPYTQEEDRWEGHTFSGSHRDIGVIILCGPGIKQGHRISDERMPTIYDVCPTILALMGLPLAEDMPGKPITEAFDGEFLQEFQPDFVATYDVNYKAGERPESIQMSAEYTERLRSLGYIQ